MAVIDRYQFPSVITTRGMCSIYACTVCGASVVQVPGDAIDRREQHADWHAGTRADAGTGEQQSAA